MCVSRNVVFGGVYGATFVRASSERFRTNDEVRVIATEAITREEIAAVPLRARDVLEAITRDRVVLTSITSAVDVL